jgi:hypothetical protein
LDLSNTTTTEEQLWNSLAAEREQGVEPTASVPPADDVLDATGSSDAAATEGTTSHEATQQGAEQGEQQATEQGTQAATADAAAAKDPVAELAERFAKLEGQLRNVNGHIGGLTQSQQQLRQQMLDAAKQATSQAGGDAPTQAQAKEAMADPEKWKALKGDFPEWGEAVESLLDSRLGNQPQFDQSAIDRMVEQRVANETAKVRTEALDAHLDTVVDGNWREVVNSEGFGKWIEAQPEEVKALGASNALTDASKMLRLFVKAQQSNPAEQIRQTRSAKLDAAASVPQAGRRAPIRKSEADMTPDELWNHYAKQREQQRG